MSNYRDDVREMLKTLKGSKTSTSSGPSSPAESSPGTTEEAAATPPEAPDINAENPSNCEGEKGGSASSELPDVEDELLDGILDLEEGDNVDDAEAEALLASDDDDIKEENGANKIKEDNKSVELCEFYSR